MRCRVRARGLLHISPPSPFFLLLFGYFARHCPIPAGHPPVERERTNKSARALRRDIVSCKVNHLRGSKTAASPRRDLLSSPHEASRRRLLPRARRFCTILSVQASPLLLLSSSCPLRARLQYQQVFPLVSPVSVNIRTHSLVINVIGFLMPARVVLNAPVRTAGLNREVLDFSEFSADKMLLPRCYANASARTRTS